MDKPKKKEVVSLFYSDPKQDISASVSKSEKGINNHNNNDDDAIDIESMYTPKKKNKKEITASRTTNSNYTDVVENTKKKNSNRNKNKERKVMIINVDNDNITDIENDSESTNSSGNNNVNSNSNSNSTNKHVKVIDESIKENDQKIKT